VEKDRNGREMPAATLGYDHGFSETTIQRVLRRHKFNCVKPTMKSGLTETMKQARLDFALKYRHWTVEEWKRVIWTDETAVVMQKRGSRRIWRRPWEKYENTCIRRRWKG